MILPILFRKKDKKSQKSVIFYKLYQLYNIISAQQTNKDAKITLSQNIQININFSLKQRAFKLSIQN